MSKIFKKENVMPVVVLGVICLIVAALLGIVNGIAAPIIQKAEEQKVYDSLRVVIDGEFAPVDPLPEGVASSVTAMYKVTDGDTLVGHAITLSAKGYAGPILMTVGVDAEGKVTKAVITSQSESHGKSGMKTYTDNFTGVAKDDVASVELFSGATISSTAIRGAIVDAVNAAMGVATVEPEPDNTLPTSEEQLLAYAAEMVGEGAEFTDVTPTESTFVKKLYRENSGKGYIVYTVVINERYQRVETETLVYVGMNGSIKNINRLTWKTSDAGWGYEPPADELVVKFYDSLIGADLAKLESLNTIEVDKNDEGLLVTQATTTSKGLLTALIEGLSDVETLIVKYQTPDYTARIVGISVLAVALFASCTVAIIVKKKRGGKNG